MRFFAFITTGVHVPERLIESRKFTGYMTTFHNVTVYEANPWQKAAFVELDPISYKFRSGLSDYNRFDDIEEIHPFWRLRINVFMYTIQTTPLNLVTIIDQHGTRARINLVPNK